MPPSAPVPSLCAPTGPASPRRPALPAALVALALLGALGALAAAAGCDRPAPPPLRPRDLGRDETQYVTRVLVLERVKARFVVDPPRGAALGDSLATAWGDSALPRTLDLAPVEPQRAERVHALLLRLLAAEQDSLLRRGGLRPLDAPWPVPADSVSGAPAPASSRVRADG